MAALEIRPVVADQLDAVRQLFSGNRGDPRHCWCMAFCSTRGQFALGWYGGGNQHRFEAIATNAPTSMLRGAVSLAHEWGASAVESWPLAAGVRRPQSLHLGTERVFAGLGFHVVAKPTEDRVFMRLDLTGRSSDSCLGADP